MSRASSSQRMEVDMAAPQSQLAPGTTGVPVPDSVLGLGKYSAHEMSSLRRARKGLSDRIQQGQRCGAARVDDRLMWEQMAKHAELPGTAPVTIVNNVDDVRAPPFDFVYCNEYVADESQIPVFPDAPVLPTHCACKGICEPATCGCRLLHRQVGEEPWKSSGIKKDFAYTLRGILHHELLAYTNAPIVECNEQCGCRGHCRNRVVGKPRKVPLQMTRFPLKGWGLVAASDVEKGQYVIAYTGELTTDKMEDERSPLYSKAGISYILQLDCFHIQRGLYVPSFSRHRPGEVRRCGNRMDELVERACKWFGMQNVDEPLLSVDAGLYGNVSRYINHSCDPNLSLFPVYTTNRDFRRPYLTMFANRDIKKGDELTFAYHDVDAQNEKNKAIEDQCANILAGGPHQDPTSSNRTRNPYGKCQCGAKNCCGIIFPWENKSDENSSG